MICSVSRRYSIFAGIVKRSEPTSGLLQQLQWRIILDELAICKNSHSIK